VAAVKKIEASTAKSPQRTGGPRAWTECKARRGSFHKRDTGSGWDGTGWWLALAHARQRERARVGRVQGGWAVEAGSRGGNTHAIYLVAAGGDEVDE
jgi:hypothetical protein